MDGQPVWLASVSRHRPNGHVLYVPEWSASQWRAADRVIRELLAGVGDPSRERMFRMNITLCLHRAATDDEVNGQPDWFLKGKGCGLAGGPVAVISETIPGALSTKPCLSPKKRVLDARNPHAWIPMGCQTCETCMAREAAYRAAGR